MDRAKIVEKKVSKLIKFIQTKNKIPKDSKRELIGLINDLQEQCHSLYSTSHDQDSDPKSRKGKSRVDSLTSELEYYSSEEIENVVEEEHENENAELQIKLEALKNESETKERKLSSRVKELERELEEEIAMKASESKELGETNKGLRSQISGLESVLKETGDEISTLVNKFGNSELGLTTRIENFKNQLRNLEQEISFLRSRNAELTGSVEIKRVQEKEHENENAELQSKLEALKKESETKERELTSRVKELEREVEEKIAMKASESKELGEKNKGLRSQISGLELVLKETGDEISTLVNKFGNSELGLTSRIEDLKNQLRNLEQEISFLRSRNAEFTGSVEIKRVQEKEHVEGLMDHIKDLNLEIESLQSQKDEFETKLEKKDEEVTEMKMQLNEEIEHIRGENQKLIAELHGEKEMKNIVINEIEDQKKLVKEQDDIIERLSAKNKDQQRIIKEQKDALDKMSDDLKQSKRRSYGSSPKLNPNALERKMEELAEDFRMKMEDHIRILYRRIHVAEQIHLESTNDCSRIRDLAQENRKSRQSLNLFEANFGKIKNILETEYKRSELTMKKLEEGEEQGDKIGRLVKEIDLAKAWIQEKKNELETLAAKLECKEAQETLLKEKLSKLEKKLAEEGTENMSLANALTKFEKRNKELEFNAKGHKVEVLSLGEEKREAIRQLCILVDYERQRYQELKKSFLKASLKP